MITPSQCRAARAWLDITQPDLARMIGHKSHAAVANFEAGKREDQFLALALQQALEDHGIKFLADGLRFPTS